MLFSKSYCPYSRAVKQIFNTYIGKDKYGLFEIDTHQDGNELHKALQKLSGRNTVPNVVIGGEFVGGDVETENMVSDGTLKTKLNRLRVPNKF